LIHSQVWGIQDQTQPYPKSIQVSLGHGQVWVAKCPKPDHVPSLTRLVWDMVEFGIFGAPKPDHIPDITRLVWDMVEFEAFDAPKLDHVPDLTRLVWDMVEFGLVCSKLDHVPN